MVWMSEMETGVELIDNQHKEIINRVNKLLEVCGMDDGYLEIEKMLDFLADYVIIHFSAEEDLQTESRYPDYDMHKKEHDGFIQKFLYMRAEYTKKGASINMIQIINDVVVGWLNNHIAKTDVAFAKYYKLSKNKIF